MRVYFYHLQPFQVEGHLSNIYQLESRNNLCSKCSKTILLLPVFVQMMMQTEWWLARFHLTQKMY